MTKRLRIFFSGTVQGVGFRYAVLMASQGFRVTGWVRNRSDGRVEILAEGLENELESFVEDVEKRMSRYIDSVEKLWDVASGEWKSFTLAPTT